MLDRRRARPTTFAEDKAFEERFRPFVGEILRGVIAEVLANAYIAPDVDDFKHNKDWGLVVDLLSHDGTRDLGVASRIRRAEQKRKRNRQGHRFTREFTIRATRPTGVDTEMRKMRLGYGGLMIYGFEAEPGADHLDPWVVLNLDKLRDWQRSKRRWREHKPNRDGSSTFITYWIEDLPPPLVVASGGIPLPLIGANRLAEADSRYAPYTRFDDWAETTRIHPDHTAPRGWLCPECQGRGAVFFGQPNHYDPATRLYVGGDTLRCIRCAVRTLGGRLRHEGAA